MEINGSELSLGYDPINGADIIEDEKINPL
jgi:hypothetical protein